MRLAACFLFLCLLSSKVWTKTKTLLMEVKENKREDVGKTYEASGDYSISKKWKPSSKIFNNVTYCSSVIANVLSLLLCNLTEYSQIITKLAICKDCHSLVLILILI